MNYYNTCYHNGNFIKIKDAKIEITSLTIRYAISVFEGIRIYFQTNQIVKVFKLHEHLQRLEESAHQLHIHSIPSKEIVNLIDQLIKINQVKEDAYVRICYTVDESGTLGFFPDTSCLSITVQKMGRKKWLAENRMMRLKISNFHKPSKKILPAKIKCISNYTASRIELKNIKMQGFDMLLFTTRDKLIAEAPTSSIFFVKSETVITPFLEMNILKSITRKTIIDICQNKNIKVEERKIHIKEINTFDEAFLCGTGIEIAPIKTIDNINFPESNPITEKLIKSFFNLVRNQL